MTRLIDADALVRDIENEIDKPRKVALLADYNHFYCAGMRNVIRLVKRLPPADPVKHGRWIICQETDRKLKCSHCGCHTAWMDEVVPNYCPYCGAMMIEFKKRLIEIPNFLTRLQGDANETNR